MILSKYVFVKTSRFYDTKNGEVVKTTGDRRTISKRVKIPVNELKPKSNIQVSCKCDWCGQKYLQKYSSNTDVCYPCRKSKTAQGNNWGSKNQKYEIPPKEELEKIYFEELKGDSHVAKLYSVSIPVVSRWRKKLGIKIKPYHGRINHTEKEEFVQDVSKMTFSQLKSKYGNYGIVTRLADKFNVTLPKTQFEIWEERRNKVLSEKDKYFKLNETLTLKTISETHDISIEVLKKVFRDENQTVKLHSYNKSKGELEIKALYTDFHSVKFEKKYEIDCYSEKHRFGVEYCGEYWHSDLNKTKTYHYDKWKYFHDQGIKIMTIFESEWKDPVKNKIICSMIDYNLGLIKTKFMARKLNIEEIDSSNAMKFYEENHIAGSRGGIWHFGLVNAKGEILSCITIGKSRYKSDEYELIRFANKINCVVSGAFSRLFGYAEKYLAGKTLVSFADLRFGFGETYRNAGFELVGITKPNYFYYNKLNPVGLESRLKYQKHKLVEFDTYEPKKTEEEIMVEAGFIRVFDCGNSKWLKHL